MKRLTVFAYEKVFKWERFY